ncbi:MAG TPA: S41 family peptidase [Pyrinomonadaceae bacterium]|nr:S41 family peptidase [Pyrinomonadaceae bacterium]
MRKSSFALGIPFLVIALALPTLIIAQQTRSARRTTTSPERTAGTNVPGGKVNPTAPAIKSDLSEALAVIQTNHIDGRKLDYNDIFKSSISGMLSVLDPHSTYFDPKEYASFRTEQRSEYMGIGATIEDLREGSNVNTFIRATFPDSPAHRAGLRFGDRILAIDGNSMAGKTYPEVRKFLLGPRGTTVKVTVEHPANKQTETVTIVRDAVSLPSIAQAYMLRPGVGYVAMTGGFNLTTDDEFGEALQDLHSKGMNMLVLDLRGNRGGLLIQAVRVANRFLQRGQMIVTQKGRYKDSSQQYAAVNDKPDGVPLVVLVNGESASAAEIVAGALQDHDRALIVGETTFGKGLVQYPFQLDYDSALLLTIAKYFTPSGRLIQRDYSNGGNYDYYFPGGLASDKNNQQKPQNGPESHTDMGRAVYGGGGIAPDETVKPGTISVAERHLNDVLFAFSLELVTGRVPGFESYKVQRPIEFEHDLVAEDYAITEPLFKELKKFAANKTAAFKVTPDQLDKSRAYAERQLRYNLLSAAYGYRVASQVFNQADPQISKAVDAMPRARELALAASRARARG